MSPFDYRDILKRLFRLEYELLGHCDCVEALDTKFSDEEKRELAAIRDEAHSEWLTQLVS